MSATPASRRPRRSRTYWARMVAEQAASELSEQAFCTQRNLGLRTFVRWKRKLNALPPPSSRAAFVELPLSPTTQPSPAGWDIDLELGDGVRLRLRRV